MSWWRVFSRGVRATLPISGGSRGFTAWPLSLIFVLVIGFIRYDEFPLLRIVPATKGCVIGASSPPTEYPTRRPILEIAENMEGNAVQIPFRMNRKIGMRRIICRSRDWHSPCEKIRFCGPYNNANRRIPFCAVNRAFPCYIEGWQQRLFSQNAFNIVDFIDGQRYVAFNYLSVASASIDQTKLDFDVVLDQATFAIWRQHFVRIGQKSNMPYSQSWSMISKKRPSQNLPLQSSEYQITSTDYRQSDVHQHRWRVPSFFAGLGLFLGSFVLLFYSSEGALEGGKWNLGLLFLNGFGLFFGLALMLIAPLIL